MGKLNTIAVSVIVWTSVVLAQHTASTVEAAVTLPQEQQAQKTIPNAVRKKVTIISVPGLSFLELGAVGGEPPLAEAMPHLAEIRRDAAWGAMNVRTPGRGIEDVYTSFGAGHFAYSSTGIQGLQADEMVGSETALCRFVRFTGESVGTDRPGGIVIPRMALLKRKNEIGSYRAQPGMLGEQLAASGVRVSVWGNLDLLKSSRSLRKAEFGRSYRRYAPLMLTDTAGRVPHGDVSGSILLRDVSGPSGLRTNYSRLLELWRVEKGSAVTLLELGDLHRLYAERASYSEQAFRQAKNDVVSEIDHFIGTVINDIKAEHTAGTEEQQELWLISPQVNPDAAKAKALLAPAMNYRPGAPEALLTSATTRRAGVVSSIDFAPSLLAAYGIVEHSDMLGLPMQAEPCAGALTQLLHDVRRMQSVYLMRPPLLIGLAVYEIAAMIGALAAVGLFGDQRLRKRGRVLWRCVLFSLLLAPAGLLALGRMPNEPGWLHVTAAIGSVVAVSAVLAAAAQRITGGYVHCLAGIGLFISALILYDGFGGARGMQWSVLGYDPMIGARYYGIGNEYMGVLLGAALLGLTALQQALRLRRRPRRAVHGPGGPFTAPGTSAPAPALAALPAAAAGTLIAGYLASPALGTNAGGALAAAAGFGALLARLAGGRSWLRAAPALALLMCAALAGLWLLNAGAATGAMADGQQSHIGRAFEALHQGRLDTIGAIIGRKLQMNWHLIGVSAWSKVLLTGLAVMAALVLRPRGVFRRWQRRYPFLMYGCAANVIGTIEALLLNDSGIVAAATMIIYSSVPLLLLKLEGA
ncbi:hypothetical protein [Paenibacillus xerothermodurans]|uniref:Uncharacterized protein n=1 Tax=Paenibacillus xerothermodurans TaxID=1977292 RepID=A0A2W1NPK5_PAEXE|nr:hypothetical protein [Paenibacillus xerothermodurans]PZE20833.1 hypothetical protein CBW46_011815 [Paenibacillus xerothermodurans]